MVVVVSDGEVVHAHALHSGVWLFRLLCLELLGVEDVVRGGGLLLHLLHVSVHIGHVVIHVCDFVIVLLGGSTRATITDHLHLIIHVADLVADSVLGEPRLKPAIFHFYLLYGARCRLHISYAILAGYSLSDEELFIRWEVVVKLFIVATSPPKVRKRVSHAVFG